MLYTPARFLLIPLALAIRAPDGPSQQCADDAGPPWSDDNDEFGKNGRYHDNTPGIPILNADGSCPDPLKKACETKPAKAAFLDGPVDCGGQGWFCRIIEEEKSWKNPEFDDSNFMHCNDTALVDDPADEHDRDGHCHGSDDDAVFGWWSRDHWFRGYAGTLHCCCGWGEPMHGIVNRCDYRKPVTPEILDTCRDA